MIIPKKHHITRLMVADVHQGCHHAGVNHVLTHIRSHHKWTAGSEKLGSRMQVMRQKMCKAGDTNGTMVATTGKPEVISNDGKHLWELKGS